MQEISPNHRTFYVNLYSSKKNYHFIKKRQNERITCIVYLSLILKVTEEDIIIISEIVVEKLYFLLILLSYDMVNFLLYFNT